MVDCLAVGQGIRDGTDERVVLFIKLEDGCTLSDALITRIRAEIRKRRTARHVPEKVSWAPLSWPAAALPLSLPVTGAEKSARVLCSERELRLLVHIVRKRLTK